MITRKKLFSELVEMEVYPAIVELVARANEKLLEYDCEKPVGDVGDFLKNSDGDIFVIEEIKTNNPIKSFRNYSEERKHSWSDAMYYNIRVDVSASTYSYLLRKKLKSGLSKTCTWKEILSDDNYCISNDIKGDFIPIDSDAIDLLNIAIKVDSILSDIHSERYKKAIERYSKSANIPKKTAEKIPNILELHEKIQLLTRFKTTLNLPL
jgi:hypothetical protein